MARLILLNGAPGCGKHSLARLMTSRIPLALALDVDDLHRSLGLWEADPSGSRRHARMLAVAAVREQLASGYDVVISQYVESTDFVEELEAVAGDLGATFAEIILVIDAEALAARIAALRHERPGRLEHVTGERFVRPEDAARLVAGVERLLGKRPQALRVAVADSPEQTLERVWAELSAAAGQD